MLETGVQKLDAQRLDELLRGLTPPAPIELTCHHSCVSTNAECLDGQRHGGLVVAEQQSGGRGRRGNDWHSPDAGNIYMSLGLELALSGNLLGLVALQVGCSTASVLRDQGFREVSLKWPNDLVIDGRKLGGILIETRNTGPGRFFLAIGLGINAAADRRVFSPVERPVASLAEMDRVVDREELIAHIAARIFVDVTALTEDRVDGLINEFLQLDAWVGKPVRVITRQDETLGLYDGVERDGRLRVRVEGRGLQCFAAAEISLREGAACC